MAAVDLAGLNSFPYVQRVTLGATDVLQEITLPSEAGRVSCRFVTNAGKVAFTGTDGAAIGTDYATFDADTWLELAWRGTRPQTLGSVFLASATGSTVVEILIEQARP